MNEAKSQLWYRLFACAVVAIAPEKLIERVEAAEAAIYRRLRDLQGNSDRFEERQLIGDAQYTLAFLRCVLKG